MYSRARKALGRRFQKIALRVKCWNLPPVATHLACFLLGTLLFEPDSSGRVPPGLLVPWAAAKVEGGIHLGQDYNLIDGVRNCLLIPQEFRIWKAEQKKLFAIVPKTRLLSEAIAALQRSDARLSLQTQVPRPHCEKKNVIIYP